MDATVMCAVEVVAIEDTVFASVFWIVGGIAVAGAVLATGCVTVGRAMPTGLGGSALAEWVFWLPVVLTWAAARAATGRIVHC